MEPAAAPEVPVQTKQDARRQVSRLGTLDLPKASERAERMQPRYRDLEGDYVEGGRRVIPNTGRVHEEAPARVPVRRP